MITKQTKAEALRIVISLQNRINLNNLNLQKTINALIARRNRSENLKIKSTDKLQDNLRSISEKLTLIFALLSNRISDGDISSLEALINDPDIDSDLLRILLELHEELEEELAYFHIQQKHQQVKTEKEIISYKPDKNFIDLEQQRQQEKVIEQQIQRSLEELKKSKKQESKENVGLTLENIIEFIITRLNKLTRSINGTHELKPSEIFQETEDEHLSEEFMPTEIEEGILVEEQQDTILVEAEQATGLMEEQNKKDELQLEPELRFEHKLKNG